ncbi:MAG: hypothetical protein U1E83_01155 [Methylotetracoccus sp.]
MQTDDECLFPGECCMPGDHVPNECHRADDYEASLDDEVQCRHVSAIEKALVQISGGLCYFTAEAKHAQLREAQRTLNDALRSHRKSIGA